MPRASGNEEKSRQRLKLLLVSKAENKLASEFRHRQSVVIGSGTSPFHEIARCERAPVGRTDSPPVFG